MDPDIEAMLRLAWQADREGRPGTRDALLTLTLWASRDSADADCQGWRAACRQRLVERLPAHWFAADGSPALKLAHEKVAVTVDRLREMFPSGRVRQLLLRGEALRGAYRGPGRPLRNVLADLRLGPEVPAAAAPVTRSLPFPVAVADPTEGATLALYWSVLVAMAALLHLALEPAGQGRDQRAA